jgi:hypothetical protein
MAGRWYRNRHALTLHAVPLLVLSTGVGAVTAELFSSGGFYVLSGRFDALSLSTFIERFWQYFPGNLSTFMFYVGLTAIIHVAFAVTRSVVPTAGAFRPSGR